MHQLFLSILFWIVHWVVILPAALLASTPYILIAALFGESRYDRAVVGYYKRICVSFAKFWIEVGLRFTP